MRGTIYGRNSLIGQWRDGQLHRPPDHQTTRDPNGDPRTTDSTHQRRRYDQPSRTNRKVLRNDHPKRTPKEPHALLQDEPRRRPNNIRVPLATNLQPPDRLGKGKGRDALAQSMGKEKEDLHRPR